MFRKSAMVIALIFSMITLATPLATLCAADSTPELIYRNGRFEPSTLSVPAGVTVQLKVTNASDSAIEFESFELNRERVVGPGRTIIVYLPGLSPGTYHFYDDLHRDAGEGTISAR